MPATILTTEIFTTDAAKLLHALSTHQTLRADTASEEVVERLLDAGLITMTDSVLRAVDPAQISVIIYGLVEKLLPGFSDPDQDAPTSERA